jgi:hypothetical protein
VLRRYVPEAETQLHRLDATAAPQVSERTLRNPVDCVSSSMGNPGTVAKLPALYFLPPCWSSLATSPVHPVWWLAPTPDPSSPWKYS